LFKKCSYLIDKGCFLKDCCFFNRKKELIGKLEQPEYTKTPRGLARQPETPEAKLRRLKLSPTESEVYSGCG